MHMLYSIVPLFQYTFAPHEKDTRANKYHHTQMKLSLKVSNNNRTNTYQYMVCILNCVVISPTTYSEVNKFGSAPVILELEKR